MDKNKRQREWEDALNLMTEDELQFIREHPVGYYQNFVKMATKKAWEIIDDPYPISEKQAMTNAIINILEELGSQCGINDDNEICFICHGANYTIRIDKDYDYVDILDISWRKIDLNDSDLVEKMIHAINKANILNRVKIVYLIDHEEKVMDIFSSSNIPYYPNYAYLKKYLQNKILDMMSTHELVNHILQEENMSPFEKFISEIVSDDAN